MQAATLHQTAGDSDNVTTIETCHHPIQWYHRWSPIMYHLATIHTSQRDERQTKSWIICKTVQSAKNYIDKNIQYKPVSKLVERQTRELTLQDNHLNRSILDKMYTIKISTKSYHKWHETFTLSSSIYTNKSVSLVVANTFTCNSRMLRVS